MGRPIKAGSVDITDYVMIRDSGDGSAETGVTITDLDLQYVRSRVAPAAKVDATELAATDTVHTDNKMKEIDGTDQPGLYRVDWPDAAFAVGVAEVVCTVKGTGFDPVHIAHELVGEDRGIIGSFTGQIQSFAADTPAAGIMRIGLEDPGLSSAANDQMNNCWLAIVDRSTREVLAGDIIGDWDDGNNYAFIDDVVFTPTTSMDYQLIFLPSAAEVSGALPIVDAAAVETKVDTVDTVVDAIKTVTDALPDAGALTDIGTDTARLTAARADVLTDWINGGRLDLLLDAIPTTAMRGTDGANTVTPPTVAEMDAAHALLATPAQVNAQVLDVMDVDTFAEPSQGNPAATLSIFDKINYLFKAWRNKSTQTAAEYALFNDAGAVVDQKATVSDAAGTFTKGEIGTGP